MNFAHEIKQRLSAREVFERYGFRPNYAGFACCPFHGEKTGSLKVYGGNRGWHCFGCHKHGDIIDFVVQIFGLSFKEAIEKLNDDFSLGLPIGEKLDAKRAAEIQMAALERNLERKRREERRKTLLESLGAAHQYLYLLDKKARQNAPK